MQSPTATEPVRLDRWLWAVRVYKTRSDATRACSGGHVTVDGAPVKPATKIRPGARVIARRGDRERVLEVVHTIDKRVGAAVAAACFVDHTPAPPDPAPEAAFAVRDRGAGRPTKRERRQMDRVFGRRR